MATEILDLNTLAPERQLAKITWKAVTDEGEEVKHEEMYELTAPEDIGTLDLARLSRLFDDHDKLWEKEKRSKAEDTRLVKLLDQIAQRLIPDAPADAIKALSAMTKRTLAVRFFVTAGLSVSPLIKGLEPQLMSSSLDSSDSTEETPSAG